MCRKGTESMQWHTVECQHCCILHIVTTHFMNDALSVKRRQIWIELSSYRYEVGVCCRGDQGVGCEFGGCVPTLKALLGLIRRYRPKMMLHDAHITPCPSTLFPDLVGTIPSPVKRRTKSPVTVTQLTRHGYWGCPPGQHCIPF